MIALSSLRTEQAHAACLINIQNKGLLLLYKRQQHINHNSPYRVLPERHGAETDVGDLEPRDPKVVVLNAGHPPVGADPHVTCSENKGAVSAKGLTPLGSSGVRASGVLSQRGGGPLTRTTTSVTHRLLRFQPRGLRTQHARLI